MAVEQSVHLSREQLVELDKLATVSASALAMDDVYEFVDDAVARLIPNDGLILNNLNKDGSTFTVALRTGPMPPNRVPGQTSPLAGTTVEALINTKEPIRLTANTLDEATRAFPGLELPFKTGFRSWLGVPLFALGEPIGGLHVQRMEPEPFTDQEVDILQRVATYIGSTTWKHQIIEAHDTEHARHEALLEIGSLLARTHSIQEAVAALPALLNIVMPVDRFVVSLWSEESQSMVDVARWGAAIPGWDELMNKPSQVLSPAHFDLNNPVMIVSSDRIREATVDDQPGLAYAREAGLESMMVASMIEEEKRTGNISVRAKRIEAYDSDAAEFFREVASLFTYYVAAQNAREIERHAQRERERALAEKRVTVAELQFERSRERLLDTISHELRTPLTVILARTDILSRRLKDQDEKTITGLNAVSKSANELKGLVNKLIDHASRAITADKERFEVTKVSDLQETLRGEVGRKFHTVDVRFADNNVGDSQLLGEATQIIGAVSEMIDNAIKYGPTDTPVQVQTSIEDNRVEISIQDEGTGLALTDASELFKPYERGAMMGNNLARGTGLGLHFAKAVAEIHGGGVRFEHDANNHSIFTLWLPLTSQL